MNKTYKRRDVMVTTFSGVSLRPFFNMKIILFLCILAVPFLFPLQSSGVDDMNEFCAVPPFIASGGVPPNVLLALDNSGSMYDLNYVDAGHPLREAQFCYDQTFDNTKPYVGYFHNNVCSVTTSTACLIDADCPGGETCEEALYQFFGECSGGGGKCTNDSECNPDGGSYCQEFNIIDTGFPALADCEYARPNIFCVRSSQEESSIQTPLSSPLRRGGAWAGALSRSRTQLTLLNTMKTILLGTPTHQQASPLP
jgi:hypothetical protein